MCFMGVNTFGAEFDDGAAAPTLCITQTADKNRQIPLACDWLGCIGTTKTKGRSDHARR